MLQGGSCLNDARVACMNLNGTFFAAIAALVCLAGGFAAGARWASSQGVAPAVSEASRDPLRAEEPSQAWAPAPAPSPPATLPPTEVPVIPGASEVLGSEGDLSQVAVQLAVAQSAEGAPQSIPDGTGPMDQPAAQRSGEMPRDTAATPSTQEDSGRAQLSAQLGGDP